MSDIHAQLQHFKKQGFVPYIATSEAYLDSIDTSIFGGTEIVKLLEREEDKDFHRAYVFSNFLGFGGTGVEMPGWVYIDCVLLQTAVIGFAIKKEDAPKELLAKFAAHKDINIDNLDYIPVSGQTAGLGVNGETLMGFSLFSLRHLLPDLHLPRLGLVTKAIGFYAQRADRYKEFIGISQYDNRALKIHGRFGEKMYIKTPMVPLHPMADMTMIYSMKIDLNDERIFGEAEENAPRDFLLRNDDKAMKQEMAQRIKGGEKFYITPPFQIEQDGVIHLPIKVEKD